MTLAHDTSTRFPTLDGPTPTNSVDVTTGNRTFSHAGSASASGAVVVLCCTGTTTTVTGVLYGGVAMTKQASAADTSEAGLVECWVLDTELVPTGTQTVTLQGCTATAKWATCSTVTASAGRAVFHTGNAVNTTIGANPSVALTTTATTLCYGGCHSGASAPPSVPLSGCTLQHQNDYGVLGSSTLRRTSPDAAGTVTLGYTLASDDYGIVAVAFAEQVIQTATASVAMTATAATTSAVVNFATRLPGPLGTADIVQVNQGSSVDAVGFAFLPVTLPAPATYGNSVIICAFIAGASLQLFDPVGFILDSPSPSGQQRAHVYRRAAVGVGESSWNLHPGAATTTIEWVVLEVAGLDPSATVDAVSTHTTGSAPTISPALPAGLSYDNFQLAVFGARNSANTTIPTWGSYSPSGFTELAEQGATQGAEALAIGVARRFPASPVPVTVSATATDAVSLAGVVVSYAAAAGRVVTDVGAFWGFEQGTLAGATLGTNPVFTATTGSPAITASTPRTGSYCLELTATAGVCSATQSAPFGTSRIGGVRVPLRFVGSLPAGDVDLFSLEIASNVTAYVRFRVASSKLAVRLDASWANGVERLSGAAVTADTWLAVEVQYDTRTTADFRADWAVDYGDGVLVPQAQASHPSAVAADITTLRLGWNTNATATVRMDDVVVVKVANNYPIRDHTVQPLGVDAGSLSTTADAKFQTFTANGTLVAWDGTVARNAIDEIPPTVSASADGIAQVTSGASDYMTIPMTTYTPGGTGIIRAVRMLLAGWAASGTAATLGFRAYDGTTEMLLAAAADPGFDNSTTTPVWVALPVRPASGTYTWDQAKLDALALRVGFGDAAVAVGLHAVLCEVLVQTAASVGVLGEAGSVTATEARDPVSGGILQVAIATPADKGTTLNWTEGGTPGSQVVPVGGTHTQPFTGDVTFVEIVSDPEAEH